MRISRFRTLSFRLPLLLLLFVLIAGSYSFLKHTRHGRHHIETRELDNMAQTMNRLQNTVQYLLNAGDIERVREEIASLGYDEALKHAMLISEAGEIVASLKRSHINQESTAVSGDNGKEWQAEVEALLARTRSNVDSQLLLTYGKSTVLGVYSILFGTHDNELRSTRYGALLRGTRPGR